MALLDRPFFIRTPLPRETLRHPCLPLCSPALANSNLEKTITKDEEQLVAVDVILESLLIKQSNSLLGASSLKLKKLLQLPILRSKKIATDLHPSLNFRLSRANPSNNQTNNQTTIIVIIIMQVEETLSNPHKPPAEVALTLLSFVEVDLAAGGSSAEKRFFTLFPLLCDRVFGPISPKEGDNFKHEVGGWFNRYQRWERPRNAGTSTSLPSRHHGLHRPGTSSAANTSIKTDPVVKLLGARPATTATQFSSSNRNNQQQQQLPQRQHALCLIEAFAKEAEHNSSLRYKFPFHGLPKSTQDDWIALIETALSGGAVGSGIGPTVQVTAAGFTSINSGSSSGRRLVSENSKRLLGSLLRIKPLEQVQLQTYYQSKAQKKEQRRPLQLSPMYNSPKTVAPSPLTPNLKDKGKAKSSPQIQLSMLEIYLMEFVRYPLASPPVQQPATSTQQRSSVRTSNGTVIRQSRRSEPYGESVYYYIFQTYVNYYIPSGVPQGHSNGFPTLPRPSELFLRFVIALWLEGYNQLSTTTNVIKAAEERSPGMQFDLNRSYDLAKSKYEPPPYQIPRCLHKLLARAVSDGCILDLVQDVHGGFRGPNPDILCLSPTMTMLQVPFYNYIRTSFRHASIHVKQSPFYSALNDWLLWIEPWNTRVGTKPHALPYFVILYCKSYAKISFSFCQSSVRGKASSTSSRIMDTVSRASREQTSASSMVTYPKPSQRSLYKPCWEPYIASNLHLYVVPLAIFLRRARELDFSKNDYASSMKTVKRVLRVFSPEVMAVINNLLANRTSGSPLSGIIKSHEEHLGVYGPPSTALSLSSCQDDMRNLLEEISLQHIKKVESMDFIDRGFAWMENVFGQGAIAGEEKEIRMLAEKAKVVVGFAADYEILPSFKSRPGVEASASIADTGLAERNDNGLFSDQGRERLIHGISKCTAQDVGYVGDRMLARPQSHEIAWLVPLLVALSQFLNSRVGITYDVCDGVDKSGLTLPKRFNLRFLADYRTLLVLVVTWFIRR